MSGDVYRKESTRWVAPTTKYDGDDWGDDYDDYEQESSPTRLNGIVEEPLTKTKSLKRAPTKRKEVPSQTEKIPQSPPHVESVAVPPTSEKYELSDDDDNNSIQDIYGFYQNRYSTDSGKSDSEPEANNLSDDSDYQRAFASAESAQGKRGILSDTHKELERTATNDSTSISTTKDAAKSISEHSSTKVTDSTKSTATSGTSSSNNSAGNAFSSGSSTGDVGAKSEPVPVLTTAKDTMDDKTPSATPAVDTSSRVSSSSSKAAPVSSSGTTFSSSGTDSAHFNTAPIIASTVPTTSSAATKPETHAQTITTSPESASATPATSRTPSARSGVHGVTLSDSNASAPPIPSISIHEPSVREPKKDKETYTVASIKEATPVARDISPPVTKDVPVADKNEVYAGSSAARNSTATVTPATVKSDSPTESVISVVSDAPKFSGAGTTLHERPYSQFVDERPYSRVVDEDIAELYSGSSEFLSRPISTYDAPKLVSDISSDSIREMLTPKNQQEGFEHDHDKESKHKAGTLSAALYNNLAPERTDIPSVSVTAPSPERSDGHRDAINGLRQLTMASDDDDSNNSIVQQVSVPPLEFQSTHIRDFSNDLAYLDKEVEGSGEETEKEDEEDKEDEEKEKGDVAKDKIAPFPFGGPLGPFGGQEKSINHAPQETQDKAVEAEPKQRNVSGGSALTGPVLAPINHKKTLSQSDTPSGLAINNSEDQPNEKQRQTQSIAAKVKRPPYVDFGALINNQNVSSDVLCEQMRVLRNREAAYSAGLDTWLIATLQSNNRGGLQVYTNGVPPVGDPSLLDLPASAKMSNAMHTSASKTQEKLGNLGEKSKSFGTKSRSFFAKVIR